MKTVSTVKVTENDNENAYSKWKIHLNENI